jgi:hypothetical protein
MSYTRRWNLQLTWELPTWLWPPGNQPVTLCGTVLLVRGFVLNLEQNTSLSRRRPELDSKGNTFFLWVLYQNIDSPSRGRPEFKSRGYILLLIDGGEEFCCDGHEGARSAPFWMLMSLKRRMRTIIFEEAHTFPLLFFWLKAPPPFYNLTLK